MQKFKYPIIEARYGGYMIYKNIKSLGKMISKKVAIKLLKTGKYYFSTVSYGFGRDIYSLKESKEFAKHL